MAEQIQERTELRDNVKIREAIRGINSSYLEERFFRLSVSPDGTRKISTRAGAVASFQEGKVILDYNPLNGEQMMHVEELRNHLPRYGVDVSIAKKSPSEVEFIRKYAKSLLDIASRVM